MSACATHDLMATLARHRRLAAAATLFSAALRSTALNSLLAALCASPPPFLRLAPKVLLLAAPLAGPDAATFRILTASLCRAGHPSAAAAVLRCMPDLLLDPDPAHCRAVLSSLCRHAAGEAPAFLEDMRLWGITLRREDHRAFVGALLREGMAAEAYALVIARRETVDAGEFEAMLRALSDAGDFDGVEEVFDGMLLRGLVPGVVVYNAYVGVLCRKGDLTGARRMLGCMERAGCPPDAGSFGAVVAGCVSTGDLDAAKEVAQEATRRGLAVAAPTCRAYSSAAAAADTSTVHTCYSYAFLDVLLQKHFAAPRRVLEVHALLLTSGALSLSSSAFPYNCLIYAHLRLSSSFSPPCAPLRLFSAMLAGGVFPNRHTFPSLLKSSASAGSFATTAAMHAQCLRRGLAEDRFVACSLLSSYARADRPGNDARKVFDEIANPDVATCNAMLDALCLTGDLSAARCFFEHMPVRDVVSWTTLISGLSRNGCHWDALEMFRGLLLENEGCLREATLVSVLSSFAHLDGAGALAAGKSVHAYVVRHEVKLSAFLGTALIDMYGKHGQLARCRSAFEMVREKEICSWNAMLSALANHGKEIETLVQFDMLRALGFFPNQITFVAVLTACARGGLVAVGLRWFEAMVSEFKLTPLMAHYVCVVDLLGRAGRFAEAIQIIKRMPFMADASVWGALIGACRLHGNVELAAQIWQKIIALGPQQSGRYMTIRNIYLEEGNWHAAMKMGEVMKEAGVRKMVGQSSVTSHGHVRP